MRHGYGVCSYADGTKFRGEWEDDCWLQSTADPTSQGCTALDLVEELPEKQVYLSSKLEMSSKTSE